MHDNRNSQSYWAQLETQYEAAGPGDPKPFIRTRGTGEQTNWKIISRFLFFSCCKPITQGTILFKVLSSEGVNQHILRQEVTGWLIWSSTHVSSMWKLTFLHWLAKNMDSDKMLDCLVSQHWWMSCFCPFDCMMVTLFCKSEPCCFFKWPWLLPSYPQPDELKTKLLFFPTPHCYVIKKKTSYCLQFEQSEVLPTNKPEKWE